MLTLSLARVLLAALAQAASTPAPVAAPDAGAGNPTLPPLPPLGFPGQYAPTHRKFPSSGKNCLRKPDAAERLACAEDVLADWPHLGRYAAANAQLPAPRRGEHRVVFIGDSITDNWSKAVGGGFFPGKPYVNRGIGSQTTAQMLIRFRADVLALAPKVVVILAGTNDVAGNNGTVTPREIQDNLTSMAELARGSGIRVVLASLLPVTDAKKNPRGEPIVRTKERPPETLRALNQWMAEYARKQRHVFLDYASALADGSGALRPELTEDGLHPNGAGYALMAPLAEKAIAAALRGQATAGAQSASAR